MKRLCSIRLKREKCKPVRIAMQGISSKALSFGDPQNKRKYKGIEKETDLSIDIFDAQFRDLDGQTGRWWQVDPKVDDMEAWSPYASNYDNPFRYSDPVGDEGEDCCDGKDLVKILAAGFDNIATHIRNGSERMWQDIKGNWGQAFKNAKDLATSTVKQIAEEPLSAIDGEAEFSMGGRLLGIESDVLKSDLKATGFKNMKLVQQKVCLTNH